MGAYGSKPNKPISSPYEALYDIPCADLANYYHQLPVNLGEYKGKVVLFMTASPIVNTLAQHTAKGLQAAVDQYGKSFVVVLIPLGGDLDLIKERWAEHGLKDCVLLEPIGVTSKNLHPLARWLRAKSDFRPLYRPNHKIMVNTKGGVYARWGEDAIPETPPIHGCEDEPNIIGLSHHIERALKGAQTVPEDYVPPMSTFTAANQISKPCGNGAGSSSSAAPMPAAVTA